MSLLQHRIGPSADRADNLQRQNANREASLVILRELRRQARTEIERLLAFLDASDIDPDLEPSLCGLTADGLNAARRCPITGLIPVVDGENGADDEPSLGSIEGINQARWEFGGSDDREHEHDGREPDHDQEDDHADYELTLGWTVDGSISGHSAEEAL